MNGQFDVLDGRLKAARNHGLVLILWESRDGTRREEMSWDYKRLPFVVVYDGTMRNGEAVVVDKRPEHLERYFDRFRGIHKSIDHMIENYEAGGYDAAAAYAKR